MREGEIDNIEEINTSRQNLPRFKHDHIESFAYYSVDKFNSTFTWIILHSTQL